MDGAGVAVPPFLLVQIGRVEFWHCAVGVGNPGRYSLSESRAQETDLSTRKRPSNGKPFQLLSKAVSHSPNGPFRECLSILLISFTAFPTLSAPK